MALKEGLWYLKGGCVVFNEGLWYLKMGCGT